MTAAGQTPETHPCFSDIEHSFLIQSCTYVSAPFFDASRLPCCNYCCCLSCEGFLIRSIRNYQIIPWCTLGTNLIPFGSWLKAHYCASFARGITQFLGRCSEPLRAFLTCNFQCCLLPHPEFGADGGIKVCPRKAD